MSNLEEILDFLNIKTVSFHITKGWQNNNDPKMIKSIFLFNRVRQH